MRAGVIPPAGMALLAGMVLLAGCDAASDAAHPAYFKAEQCRAAGDYEAAAGQLRRFLRARPESPDGHLAMASLCDENLDDPAGAIFHYREFLRLAPDSENAAMARAWLAGAEEKYRNELNRRVAERVRPGEAPEPAVSEPPPGTAGEAPVPAEAAALEALRRRNRELTRMIYNQQRQLIALQNGAPAPGVPEPETEADASGVRIYRVRSGDTLGRIARQFYGSSAKFRGIMKANRLEAGTMLRIGQELRIPPASEAN